MRITTFTAVFLSVSGLLYAAKIRPTPIYDITAEIECYGGKPTGAVRELVFQPLSSTERTFLHSRELQAKQGNLFFKEGRIYMKKAKKSKALLLGQLSEDESLCLNPLDPVTEEPILSSSRLKLKLSKGLRVHIRDQRATFRGKGTS